MVDSADGHLGERVAALQAQVNGLRRTGDIPALLAAALAAAVELEQRAGGCRDEAERQALLAVKRFSYNAAADAWPGWSAPAKVIGQRELLAARELAEGSARLVTKLGLGPIQEGTGRWLCGAFDLALARYADASRAFAAAEEHYIAAPAPGLALLTRGYTAIVRQLSGEQSRADAEELEQVIAQIAAGNYEDGEEWITQLRTALQAFAR